MTTSDITAYRKIGVEDFSDKAKKKIAQTNYIQPDAAESSLFAIQVSFRELLPIR